MPGPHFRTGPKPELTLRIRRLGLRPSPYLLVVSVARQRLSLFRRNSPRTHQSWVGNYRWVREYVISTSRFGTGQVEGSNRTPLGLHRIARKIGAGQPIGTVFKSRLPVGLTWDDRSDAAIVHRILWLEGLEPGFNRGGSVDTFRRYIYIHGFGDETTLGRPQSHGCIHLAAVDLMPLFDRLAEGTLVWIEEQ